MSITFDFLQLYFSDLQQIIIITYTDIFTEVAVKRTLIELCVKVVHPNIKILKFQLGEISESMVCLSKIWMTKFLTLRTVNISIPNLNCAWYLDGKNVNNTLCLNDRHVWTFWMKHAKLTITKLIFLVWTI